MSNTDQIAEPVEFKDEQIQAVVLRKKACLVEMRIKAAPPLVQSARRAAVKAVGKEILLPGFRKGRAPSEMILKKYPSEVEQETHNKLADAVFAATQKLANIPLLNQSARVVFDLQKIGEEGAELLFHFETEPNVPSVDPKRFHPDPVERATVGEQEINEAIRQMRFFFASWTPVLDRPIQEKDYLIIDLDTIEGDALSRVFNKVRFEVSKERMAEWMQKLVIGAKVGDVVEGISEPDATATDEDKKEFQPKKVRIAILKVEEAVLPELDDEFAKKVGATDVAHMRQSISSTLNRQADEKMQNALREQVNDFLIREYSFELPQSLILGEKQHRLEQLRQDSDFKKNWETFSQEQKTDLEARIVDESTHAIKLFYLSRQVVRDAKIGITYQEVYNDAIATLKSHGIEQKVDLEQIPKEVYTLSLSKIILARAQDFIIRMQKA
ncbi:MAG TPA: trigger factor [Chlamydiales bacterium]|nr:trigger factor [Chlamydiales bacterium]